MLVERIGHTDRRLGDRRIGDSRLCRSARWIRCSTSRTAPRYSSTVTPISHARGGAATGPCPSSPGRGHSGPSLQTCLAARRAVPPSPNSRSNTARGIALHRHRRGGRPSTSRCADRHSCSRSRSSRRCSRGLATSGASISGVSAPIAAAAIWSKDVPASMSAPSVFFGSRRRSARRCAPVCARRHPSLWVSAPLLLRPAEHDHLVAEGLERSASTGVISNPVPTVVAGWKLGR